MMNRKKTTKFDAVPLADILQKYSESSGISLTRFVIKKYIDRPISLVFRIKLELENGDLQNIYLKYYKPVQEAARITSVVKRDFETTRFWYNRFKKSKTYKVVEPLYADPEKSVLITRESSGYSLWEYINKNGQFFPSADLKRQMFEMTRRSGQWLRFFQEIPFQGKKSLIELEEIIDYISLRLNRLQDNSKIKFDEQLKKDVLYYIRKNWNDVSLEERGKSYVHADLSLSNILIDSDTVTVLDFNKIEIGSPFKDLTRFCHQLQLLKNKPTFNKRFVENLQIHFLEGYEQPEIIRHPLFKIYLMIHTINHLGKTARYWEHSFVENIYNRWIVRNTLNRIRKIV